MAVMPVIDVRIRWVGCRILIAWCVSFLLLGLLIGFGIGQTLGDRKAQEVKRVYDTAIQETLKTMRAMEDEHR